MLNNLFLAGYRIFTAGMVVDWGMQSLSASTGSLALDCMVLFSNIAASIVVIDEVFDAITVSK